MNEQISPKISVIIPAYNSGATVSAAVFSALRQTYANIEVIVIDDGSADDTSAKVRQIAEKDERVRLIIKPNGGVSAARNDGIMASDGEWFVTLDADDYIDADMLSQLYDAAVRTDADTVMCGFRMVYPDGRKTVFKVDDDYADEKEAFIENMFIDLYDRHMISTHSNQLFNTGLVKKNRIFYNEKLSVNEDIDFVLRYLKHCGTIGVIKGAYLNYVQNDDGESLITTFQSYGIASSLLILRDCNELFDELDISDETIDEMNNRLFWHICSFVGAMYYRSSYSDERKIAEIEELCCKEDFADLLNDLRPKGLKTRTAAYLLKSNNISAYHRLCKSMYAGIAKTAAKSSGTVETLPETAYDMLGMYSDIYAEEKDAEILAADRQLSVKEQNRAETDTASLYGMSTEDSAREAIDTDVIMRALEKSADDSVKEHENKPVYEHEKKRAYNTSVTMEDILKVRQMLSGTDPKSLKNN